MSEQVTENGSDVHGITKAEAKLVLNWVLATYNNPNARPGVVPNLADAVGSMNALHRRARLEAALLGVRDPNLAEEAVSVMLETLAASNLLRNYQRPRGTPRRYINAILRRAVLRMIRRPRRAVEGVPLHEGLTASEPGPAAEVEVRDLEEACRTLLRETPATEAGLAPAAPAATQYLRRHRARKALWAKVGHLFPGVPLRPRRRRAV